MLSYCISGKLSLKNNTSYWLCAHLWNGCVQCPAVPPPDGAQAPGGKPPALLLLPTRLPRALRHPAKTGPRLQAVCKFFTTRFWNSGFFSPCFTMKVTLELVSICFQVSVEIC